MNLIDRYVKEVGRRLPRKERGDVEVELRSLLQDTLEDRVEGKATEDDVVALLQEFGSPEEVAASYRPSGQYFIGPQLYPTFKLVTGAVLLAVTIALVVANTVGLLFGPAESIDVGQRLLTALGNYFQAILSALGSIVVVFAILQRLDVRPDESEEAWDPRDLPDVKDVDLVGRGESVAAIAFSVVFLIILNMFGNRIGFVRAWGLEPVLAEIMQDALPWLNAALLLGLALNVILLWQGRWHLYTRLAKVVVDLFWIYIIYRVVTTLPVEAALVEAGLTEPLPTLFSRLGYFILALVVILFVVNTVKWIYQSLVGGQRS